MGLKTGIELLKTKMGKAKDFYQSTKSMNTINNINVSIPDGGIKTEEFSFDEQYTVQKGDTLGKIANQYGLSYQDLADYNGIADPNKIDVGQKILIPDVETIPQVDQSYIVQKGDTLGKIAASYGLSYQELADYNGIADPNNIEVGWKIQVPEKIAEFDKIDSKQQDEITEEQKGLVLKYVNELGDNFGNAFSKVNDATLEAFKRSQVIEKSSKLPEETKIEKVNNNDEISLQRSDYTEIGTLACYGDPAADDVKEAQKIIVNTLLSVVQDAHKKTGAPTSVLIAQGLLESAYLSKSAGKNNIMSMNVFDNSVNQQWESEWNGDESINNVPQEVSSGDWVYGNESMRNYDNMSDAVTDCANFLVQYKVIGESFENMTEAEKQEKIIEVSKMSSDEYIDKIKNYATDSQYANKLRNMIDKYDLKQYDTVLEDRSNTST